MISFEVALRSAESDLMSADHVRVARQRVAARLEGRGTVAWPKMLAYAASATLCLAIGYGGYAAMSTPADETVASKEAEQPQQIAPGMAAPMKDTGLLVVTAPGSICDLTINGNREGVHTSLQRRVPLGTNEVICETKDGRRTRKTVDVEASIPAFVTFEIEPVDDGPRGTLVAIAIGGSCEFAVDGEIRGKKSSIRIKVAVGNHTVTCDLEDGRTLTQSVTVRADKPGIASFRIDEVDAPGVEIDEDGLMRPRRRSKDLGF